MTEVGIDSADQRRRTSWLLEHDFEPTDVVPILVGLFLCVGYGSFFLVPNWTPRMMVLLAVAPLGLAFMLVQTARRDAIAITSTALVSVAVIAGVASGHARSTLLGTVGTEESALILLSAVGLTAIGREATPQGRRATGWAVVVGAAISCAVGLTQFVAKADTGIFAMVGDRASGLTPNPVYFGSVAAGAFGIVLGRKTTNPRTLVLDAALAAWFGVAIAISDTRVALGAALVVASVVIGVRRVRRPIIVSLGLLGGVVAGSIATNVFGAGASAAARVTDGSSGDRRALWAQAFDAFRDRPLVGWGLGEFRLAVQNHISIQTSRRFGRNLEGTLFDAHNTFFGVAVSLGVAGLIVVAVLVLLIGRNARGALAVGASALALSWMLQPMGLSTFPLAMLLAGAALPPTSARAADPARATTRSEPLGHRRMLLWLLVPGLAASVCLGAIDVGIEAAVRRSDPRRVEELVEAFPPDPVLADIAAQAWRRDGVDSDPKTVERVLYWSERARDLQADRSRWWFRLGVRQYEYGDVEGALDSMQQARNLEPNAWSVVNAQMILFDKLGLDAEYDELTPLACELGVPSCPST